MFVFFLIRHFSCCDSSKEFSLGLNCFMIKICFSDILGSAKTLEPPDRYLSSKISTPVATIISYQPCSCRARTSTVAIFDGHTDKSKLVEFPNCSNCLCLSKHFRLDVHLQFQAGKFSSLSHWLSAAALAFGIFHRLFDGDGCVCQAVVDIR